MKINKIKTLIVGLCAVNLIMPLYNASEIDSEATSETGVEYTAVNSTSKESVEAAPTDLVTFKDTNLEQAVSTQLGVPVGEITIADMSDLYNLNVESKDITDLSGLEYANNLYELRLQNNSISDLSPISGLRNLKILDLAFNSISDLSPISGLTSLTNLHVDYNQISDLSPISSMTSLTALYFTNNQISDISVISGMTSLLDLHISSNPITDISPISGLISIDTLYMDDINLSDLSPISGMVNLTELQANSNQIIDLSPLSELTSLDKLYLDDNNISDVTALSGLSNLNVLDMIGNHISDLSSLAPLVSAGTLTHLGVIDQTISLDDIVVNSDDEISYNVIDYNGNEVPVSLGTPVAGVNDLSGTFSVSEGLLTFEGTVTQNVTYQALTGLDEATSNEHAELSDDQLITLFNVVSIGDNPITVDQSTVDYNTPGVYNVQFSDSVGNKLLGKITVKDILPTIDAINTTVSIEVGDSIDYLTAFGVSATELSKGDLTSSIIINDENVDYNTPGTYPVEFSVSDDEGNIVTATYNLVITQASITPAVSSDVEEQEASSDVEEQEASSEVKKQEVKSEHTNLATTGTKSVVLIFVMALVMLLGLKKVQQIKE